VYTHTPGLESPCREPGTVPEYTYHRYCMGQCTPHNKKYQQVLKLGANEASAQGLQNAIQNVCHTKLLTKL
jgi:hypothetical protein